MAIKDWKKTVEEKSYPHSIHWKNKKINGYVKYSFPFKNSHEVEIFDDLNDIHNTPNSIHSFRNKKEAFSYAKKLMRSH